MTYNYVIYRANGTRIADKDPIHTGSGNTKVAESMDPLIHNAAIYTYLER